MNRTEPWPVGTRVVLVDFVVLENTGVSMAPGRSGVVLEECPPGSAVVGIRIGESHNWVRWGDGVKSLHPARRLRRADRDPDQTETEHETEELTA